MNAEEHLKMASEAMIAAIRHLVDAQKLLKGTEPETEEEDETDQEIQSLLGGK